MIVSLLLFLSSFAFYLHGVSPALDGGDSGEFIASSFTLGVPHAPGYPLFQLLGKAFQFLMPFSSIAYRCHVLSALIASSFLVLFYRFLMALLGDDHRFESLTATIFLALTPLFVEQARVSEVFLLNAAFAVAIIFCLAENELVLGSFLFGLGLGNHHTLLAVSPLFLLSFANRRGPGLRHAGETAFFFLLGLSIYIYLPLRAHAGPPVNFGDPETWARFWAVVTRKEFGALALHPAALPFRDGKLVFEQTARFFGRVIDHNGVVGLVLALAGAAAGLSNPRRRSLTLLTLAAWLALGWGFEVYSNLSPFSDIGQWRLERFYLSPLCASAVLTALALEARPVFVSCAVIAVAAFGISRVPSFRSNFVFRDFATSALRSAPNRARIVIDRVLFDEPTSSLLVASVVEKKRPDVFFFYRPGTLFAPVYGKDLLDLNWDQRVRRQRQVEADSVREAAFPVRFLAFEKANAPFPNPRLEGLLYARTDAPRDLQPFIVARPGGAPDYPSRLIGVHFPYFFGKAAIESGEIDIARRWFETAVASNGGMAWLLSNIGGMYAHADALPESQRAFEQAVEADPYFYDAHYGLGYTHLKNNRLDASIRAFETAARIAPDRAEGAYMLGVAYQAAGQNAKAAASWEKYLALEPRGKMVSVVKQQLEEMKWK